MAGDPLVLNLGPPLTMYYTFPPSSKGNHVLMVLEGSWNMNRKYCYVIKQYRILMKVEYNFYYITHNKYCCFLISLVEVEGSPPCNIDRMSMCIKVT